MARHRPALRPGGIVPRVALAALPVAFLGLFFAYPFATILERSLRDGIPWDVVGTPRTWSVLGFTLWQAAASTALTLAAGLPLAWAIGSFRFRGRSTMRAVVLVPFVLPTVVVATAFVTLLPAGWSRGIGAVLAAHVFFNLAVVVRVVGGAWARLPPTTWEAAAVLGAGPWRRFRTVTIGLLTPSVLAAAALTFLFCFTSFGVVLVLGGPGRSTLETEIYSEATRTFDLRTAATLSLVQLAAIGLVLVVGARFERRLSVALELVSSRETLRPPRGRERWAVAAAVIATGGFVVAPIASLVVRSLSTPAGAGFDHYRALARETPALLVTPWHAIGWSLLYAALATAIALVVAALTSLALAGFRPGVLDAAVLLPLGVSAVMLGFGFVIAFGRPPLEIRDAWWLLPVVQATVAAPFAVRILLPTLRSIDPRLREAAATLGASPRHVVRTVVAPLIARPFAAAAAFALAIALGEFGASVFVSRSDRPTLPVAIFRFLGRPGAENQGTAAALAVCLALLTVAVAALAEAAGDGKPPA